MTAVLCTLLSAAGFYFSLGLGDQWWLAWLAPIPILWLAFGESKGWTVFLAGLAAMSLGWTSILRAYWGAMPVPVLLLAIFGPSLLFAASVTGARRVQRAFGPVPAMFAFAVLWAALDFLMTFNKSGGAIETPATSQVGAPMLMQTASLIGFLGVTFLLGAVSAGIAASLRTRTAAPAAIAILLFAANAGFGYWRMQAPPESHLRVALIESNDTIGGIRRADRTATLKAVDAYAAEIEKLRGREVALIMMPENLAMLEPAYRDEAEATLGRAAHDAGATLVAGFNTFIDGAERNVSLAFAPDAPRPMTYLKRRLVPKLETDYYTPGPGPAVTPGGIGLEICKDMDFPFMLRADEVATHPVLLAVPAWDFDKDDWAHGRAAIMRSIENGVPMARDARDGLLTLNDRYGRIVARARTTGPFLTLVGELPLAGRGGDTLYDRIGDAFGWLCVAAGIALIGAALLRKPKAA
jgi:apolipoprotein N-acyltransferase